VDQVETGAPAPKVAPGPQAEGQRLRETADAHGPELEHVDQVADAAGGAEGVLRAVEVEALEPGQGGADVELGIGLAGDDLDVVSEPREGAAQVPDVDALPPGVRIAPVGQERDA